MSGGNKNKKPDSLESLLQHIQKQNKAEGKIDKAFEQYDKVIGDDDTYNEFYINVLKPAHNDLYETFKDEILGEFDKDLKKKLKGKDIEKVKKVLVKALKKYFEKANKGMLEHLDEKADTHEQFQYLAQLYDTLTLRSDNEKQQGLTMYNMPERLTEGGDKLSDIIMQFGKISESHRDSYIPALKGKAGQIFLSPFSQYQVATHVYDEIHNDEGPYKIEDKMKWLTSDHQKILQARTGVKKGRLPEGADWKHYHIKYEKEAGDGGHAHH